VPDAYIFDAVRTPRGRGKKSGSLYTVRPTELLATALRGIRDRNELDTSELDEVAIGCVTQVPDLGAGSARTAVLEAKYADTAPGVTLNRFCGSGLEAVNHAAALVASGYCDLAIGGGVESMSRVAMGADGGAVLDPAYQHRVGWVPQGISADLLATLRGIDRREADEYAPESQKRAAAAQEDGRFEASIIPVVDKNGLTILDRDEHPRPGTTADDLAKLRPSFAIMGEQFALDAVARRRYPQVEKISHIHHAGNSSGIVDGAAAILVGSEEKGRSLGLKARARIRSVAIIGDEPILMLDGPIPASKKALKRAGMVTSDIDLFEVNEAFAAVPLAFMRGMNVSHDKVNVDGGAIALGHPLGATGTMILGTLLDALERKNLNTGLATLCIGGGMGIATIIERV